jgi:crotonobetainyl-CoA:carnitine CoA-transferase CaiB-like acyl-CoA transferase
MTPMDAPARNSSETLSDLRVVELSGDIGGQYAGRLLALLGADVVRASHPALRDWVLDAPPRVNGSSGLDQYLNGMKRRASLPESDAAAREALDEILADADLCILDAAPASLEQLKARPEELIERHPTLVASSLSVFGLSGPLAETHGADLNGAAFSGIAWAVGEPGREPLALPYSQCSYQLGIHGAAASLAAVRASRASGAGQVVDVAMAEIMAGYVATLSPLYAFYGIRYVRDGYRPPGSLGRYPATILPCRDGAYCLVARSGYEWKGLLEIFGNPEWAKDERYRDLTRMGVEFPGEVDAHVMPHLSELTKDELFELCLERGVPSAPVKTVPELAEDEHLRERGFFLDADALGGELSRSPGLPFWVTPGNNGSPAERAPSNGSRGTSGLPYEGVRILDFGWVWAAPLAGGMMADLGAEVIRIESRKRLEPNRLRVMDREGGEDDESLTSFPYFRLINRNKLSCTLDLKHEESLQIVYDLVAGSDIVLSNFKPGVMDRLGLGFDDLSRINPRIITVALSAAGNRGRYSELKGYGASISSLGGVESLAGYVGEQPIGTLGANISDPSGASYGALAMIAALHAREQTGVGLAVDVSQMEAVAASLGEAFAEFEASGETPRPRGNDHPVFFPHGIFACKEPDTWISIVARDGEERARLARAIGITELAGGDEERWVSALTDWAAARERDEAWAILREARVAAAPVMTDHDVFADAFYRERDTLPLHGEDRVPLVPWHLSASPPATQRGAPAMGEHTADVLRRVAGYSDERIDELARAGVLE